ncbi:Ig-like domain-containing protein [Spirosoma pollinicola]|uniref:Tandem-95 repeat protein n=1 Tax=Spirosoma pollinicola TaxID=2057025 RepID=A0A2K8ZAS4_9BACT|nr:Ig-like domain-containing protein [Spirosoma pollinicola]AUD06950.1 hypothetical protein CWM47_36995 [Spirosoma pollinicola]
MISGLTASTSYTVSYSKNGAAAQTVVLTSTAAGAVTVTGLGQGSYQLTSLGTSNCTSAQTLPAVVLVDPAGPALAQNQVSGTNPTACNATTGSITLSGLTASTSYTVSYSKNGGSTVAIVQNSTAGGLFTISGLGQGNYTISNLGTNNCTSMLSLSAITLSDPAAPILSAASLVGTNPTTCGTATGSFSVTGLNANVSYTLSYEKDGGVVAPVSLISNALGVISVTGLATGSYGNFVLTNNLGCSTAPLVGPFNLSNPSLPTPTVATLTSVNASCGGNDGKLQLSGLTAGQTFVFHYQLGSIAQAKVAPVNASGILSVTGLSPGVYSDFYVTQGACISGTYPGPITLNANCLPPVVTPDIASTSPGKPVTGNVLTNDTDPNTSPTTGGQLTASLINQPAVGSVVLNPDGSYTYTPPTGFTGVTSFCYLATNTAGLSASTCVSIHVNPDPSPLANDAPIANNDNTQTTMGVAVTINAAANDTDPDSATSLNGQLNTPTILAQPSVGVASVVNGKFVYTPPANFTGVVSFPYSICDKATPALCATAVVTINVQPTPPVGTTLSPVAVDDALLTTKNTSATGTVAANDSDPNSPALPLTFTSGQPAHGTVVMGPNGTYAYIPVTGYSGPDSFTYLACNTAGKCDVATVTIDVQVPANLPPVLVGEPIVTDQGKPVTVCLPIVDGDVTDTHSVTVCGQPGNGVVTAQVNNTTHQVCLTYTPTPGFTGSTSVCITVCDAAGSCTTVLVPITVIPTSQTIALPQPPVVVVVPIVTPKDSTAQVCMTIVDPNMGDVQSVTLCSSPTKGSVTATVNNTTNQVCVLYKPTPGSVGPDAVCLLVCDQSGLCTQVTVPVTIVDPTPPGTTPVAPVVTPTPIVVTAAS